MRHVKYAFKIEPEKKAENIAWIQKHGIRLSLLLPVKKPGSYYVRASVKDTGSDKIGSAYQYLEIPDLEKKGLALSDIFIITSADDLEWMRSDLTKDLSEAAFSLVFQAEEARSPALRTYAPGNILQLLTILYNANAKAVARSEIELQTVLYKDGKEFLRGEANPVSQTSEANPDGIAIMQGLAIGANLTPGDYALQMIVTDNKNSKKKEGVAAKTLSFTVKE
jgi:hypothetical protein